MCIQDARNHKLFLYHAELMRIFNIFLFLYMTANGHTELYKLNYAQYSI